MRIALIDVGTNTLRLLVGESSDGKVPNFLFQEVIPTRLGEGLSESKTLTRASIDRTVEGLKRLQALALQHKPDLVEAYATAWARTASNTDEMLSEMARLNLPIWILTEQEEALMDLEAVRLMPTLDPSWIIDVGGGSTEVIGITHGKVTRCSSIPLGAVNFTEMFLSHESPIQQLSEAIAKAQNQFVSVSDDTTTSGSSVVAIGGTAAVLAALKIGKLPRDPIFFESAQALFLDKSWLDSEIRSLARLTIEERKRLPGMEPERADILLGGTILLHAFLEGIRANGFVVCLYSFIHGLMAKRFEWQGSSVDTRSSSKYGTEQS